MKDWSPEACFQRPLDAPGEDRWMEAGGLIAFSLNLS